MKEFRISSLFKSDLGAPVFEDTLVLVLDARDIQRIVNALHAHGSEVDYEGEDGDPFRELAESLASTFKIEIGVSA